MYGKYNQKLSFNVQNTTFIYKIRNPEEQKLPLFSENGTCKCNKNIYSHHIPSVAWKIIFLLNIFRMSSSRPASSKSAISHASCKYKIIENKTRTMMVDNVSVAVAGSRPASGRSIKSHVSGAGSRAASRAASAVPSIFLYFHSSFLKVVL